METPNGSMIGVYVLGALMTLTGVDAEQRLGIASSAVAQSAEALLAQISGGSGAALSVGVDPKWVSECAKDLVANKGQSLVVAGYGGTGVARWGGIGGR